MTSGAATDIGPTGTFGIVGSAFAGSTFGTSQLYGFLSDGTTGSIDTATGAATLLNNNGLDDIFGGAGIVDFVPEPSAMTMLVLGGLSLLGWRFVRARQVTRI